VTIEVVETAAAAPAAPAPGAPKLAETGVEVNAAMVLAGAFLLLGSIVVSRRRHAAH
jgi:LPXTG-motif cell wall-anchored protein